MTQLQAGSTIAGYRVDTLIQSTDSGSVVTATQEHLQRQVMLQVVEVPPRSAAGAAFRSRAERLAALDDPRVLPVYEVFETESAVVAVEAARGVTLAHWLDEHGPFEAAAAIELCQQLAGTADLLAAQMPDALAFTPSTVVVGNSAGMVRAYVAPLHAQAANSPRPSAAGALARLLATLVSGHDDGASRLLGGVRDEVDRQLRDDEASSATLFIAAVARALQRHTHARRRVRALLAAGAIVAVSVLGVVLAFGNHGAHEPSGVPPPHAPVAQIAARIPVGGSLGLSLTHAVLGDSIWLSTEEGRLIRINMSKRQVVGAPTRLPAGMFLYAAGDGALWITNLRSGLDRMDPATRRITGRLRVRGITGYATFASHQILLTHSIEESEGGRHYELLRFDTRSLRRIGRPVALRETPFGVQLAGQHVLVTNFQAGSLTDVASARQETKTIAIGEGPYFGTHLNGAFWIPSAYSHAITRVELKTLRPTFLQHTVSYTFQLISMGGTLWATTMSGPNSSGVKSIYRLDPRDGRPLGRPLLVQNLGSAVAARGALWMADPGTKALLEIVPTARRPAARVRVAPDRTSSGLLGLGRHDVPEFPVPFSVSADRPDWVMSEADWRYVDIRLLNNPPTAITIAIPDQVAVREGRLVRPSSVGQVIRLVRRNPAIKTTRPKRVTLGNLSGYGITMQARRLRRFADWCARPCVTLFAVGDSTFGPERTHIPTIWRLFVLQADDRVVLVLDHREVRTPAYPGDPLLRSLEFRPG